MPARGKATAIAAINPAVAATPEHGESGDGRGTDRNATAAHSNGSRNQPRRDQLHLQAREHRQQERKRIAVDDQEVEECQRKLQNSELEVRQRDQDT